MTWIDKIKEDVSQKYNITPKISENFDVKYKRYHHMAFFRLSDHRRRYTYSPQASGLRNRLCDVLEEKLRDTVRTQWFWDEVRVYFENLDQFLAAIPKNQRKFLTELSIMRPTVIDARKKFTHEHPVHFMVRNKLPFDKYRYRVWVSGSNRVRKRIGVGNLEHLCDLLSAYDGVHIPNKRALTRPNNSSGGYFYSETLDYLPMIYLSDPSYIRKIEYYQTTEEIEKS